MKKRIENIINHDKTATKLETTLSELEAILKNLETLHPNFKRLMEYYSDFQWQKDYEDSNIGKLEVQCAILSQDYIYDLYQKQREVNFKMARIALDYLEK